MKQKILMVIVVLAVGIQFVPVDRTNPPVPSDFGGPAAVREIFVRSCYDCHSHETSWPWYSRVAPISFMVARHVQEGREELNFSAWGAYDARQQQKLATEILEVVEKAEMPMPVYVILHGETKITGSELQTLRAWRP